MMRPKPKITFFVPGLGVGGAERHTIDLRARLEALGYRTSLLVYGKARSERTLALPGAHDPVMLGCGGPLDPRSWLRVGRALARENPDLLVAVNQTPVVTTMPFRWRLRCPVVGVFHSTLLRPGEGLRTALFTMAARSLDTLVYVSENQRSHWRKRGLRARRDTAIVNGIDLARFTPRPGDRGPSRHSWKATPDDFVIGLVAAIRPEKNHQQLVDALATLRANGIPAQVVLVGDGPGREALVRHVDALGMAPHVTFAGEQSDVRPFIAGFDVGVLCSTSIETLSLSALEILAGGVPLVMSDIGGASEIVRDGVNGYLFEAGSTNQLVDRLTRVARPDVRRKLTEAARASAAPFNVERMLDGYVALIEDLAGRDA